MLTRISKYLVKNQKYKELIIGKTIKRKQQQLGELTEEYIKRANNLKQLVQNANTQKLARQENFSKFMLKVTQLMNKQVRLDPESVACLDLIMFQIRKFNPVNIYHSANDLLNYHLFFKQLKTIFPNSWQPDEFEMTATVQAQAIPINASFNRYEPVAVALLYYMLIFNQLKSQQIYENIQNYFLRYFQNLKLGWKVQNTNQQINEADNEFLSCNGSEQLKFDPSICAILLSCLKQKSKRTLQSTVEHRIIFNLGENILAIKQFLGITQLTQIYMLKYTNCQQFQLSTQEKKEIQQVMAKKHKYKLEENCQLSMDNQKDNGIVIVNKYTQFLQSIDIFISLLTIDYKCVLEIEVDYRASEELSRYFFMIFLLCQNMSIQLVSSNATQKAEDDVKLPLFFNIENQKDVQFSIYNIKLWKIAAEIVEAFSKNRIYNGNKNNILSLILWKAIDFIKINIHSQLAKQNEHFLEKQKGIRKKKGNNYLKSKILGYESAIVKLFTFMPIDILKKQYQRESDSHHYILQIFKLCVEQLPPNSEDRNLLINNIISFLKLKKTLIFTKTEWMQIFESIIKQDTKHECWTLYFFLGASQEQKFIQLIPFPSIISKLSIQRQEMKQSGIYLKNNQLITSSKLKQQSQQIQEEQQRRTYSRYWQLQVLKLYALTMLVNIDDNLPKLLTTNCFHYKLTTSEIQNLLQIWIEPFKHNSLTQLRGRNDEISLDSQFCQQNVLFKEMPIACFEKYFNSVFFQTKTYYQLRLIYKILSFPSVENYLVHWKNYTNYNFLSYFFTLLFGLGDQKHRDLYIKKYSFQKIVPLNLKLKNFYNNEYNNKVPLMTHEFFLEIQWSYFLKCLLSIDAIFQGKDLYISILESQEIHKIASIKVDYQQFVDSIISPPQNKQITNESQQFNLQLNQFLDCNFSQCCTYNITYTGYKYSIEKFAKINHIIINAFIENLLVPINFAFKINARLTFVANYLYELGVANEVNLQPNLQLFIQKQQIQKLNQIIRESKLQDDKQLAIMTFKLNELKLLNMQTALIIYHSLNFHYFPSITKLICLSAIGRTNSIRTGVITENDWNQLEKEIIHACSSTRYSFIWLYYALICSKPKRFMMAINLLKKIYHPIHRKAYINELIKIKQKYNITDPPSNANLLQLLHKKQFQIHSYNQIQSEYMQETNKNGKNQKKQENKQKIRFLNRLPENIEFSNRQKLLEYNQKNEKNKELERQNFLNQKKKKM